TGSLSAQHALAEGRTGETSAPELCWNLGDGLRPVDHRAGRSLAHALLEFDSLVALRKEPSAENRALRLTAKRRQIYHSRQRRASRGFLMRCKCPRERIEQSHI